MLYGISGYLVLGIEGESVERFLNMCRVHGIELWSIRQNNGVCTCRIYADDFIKLKPIAKKTKTRIKVLNKKGLPFLIPILKRHLLLIIIVMAVIILLIYSNNFVWAIEYVGNLQISDDELDDFIASEDIYYGIRKKDIDCDMEEKNIRERFPNVIWTSVYFEGTKLFVSIKENEKAVPKADTGNAGSNIVGSDIVADEDGVIVSMLIRNGVAMVGVGDEVNAGDMLISGSVPVYNEEQEVIDYQIYDADADIFIQTQYEYNKTLSNTYAIVYYTGNNIKSRFIQIFGYDFSNLKLNKFFREKRNMRYETSTSRHQAKLRWLSNDNFYLPVYYGEINRKEYYMQYRTYTEDEMRTKLTEDLQKIISGLEENGIKIVEKNVKMVQNSNSMGLNGNLVIIKKTGVSNLLEFTLKE
jgi:similar to stage IV sporulation protein